MEKELFYNKDCELIEVRIDGEPIADTTIKKGDEFKIYRKPKDFFAPIKEHGGEMGWKEFMEYNRKWHQKCLEDVKRRMEG